MWKCSFAVMYGSEDWSALPPSVCQQQQRGYIRSCPRPWLRRSASLAVPPSGEDFKLYCPRSVILQILSCHILNLVPRPPSQVAQTSHLAACFQVPDPNPVFLCPLPCNTMILSAISSHFSWYYNIVPETIDIAVVNEFISCMSYVWIGHSHRKIQVMFLFEKQCFLLGSCIQKC